MDNNYFPEPIFMEKAAGELTQPQLLERIAYKIWRRYNGAISKSEAYEGARNLTGLCETLMEIEAGKYQKAG